MKTYTCHWCKSDIEMASTFDLASHAIACAANRVVAQATSQATCPDGHRIEPDQSRCTVCEADKYADK
mgnify:CR=1 FL=1